MARPVKSCHSAAPDRQGEFIALKLDIDDEGFEAGSIPGGSGHFAVTGFKVYRVQFMGDDWAAEVFSYGFSSAGMIKVTVGQQEIFEPNTGSKAFGDVLLQA